MAKAQQGIALLTALLVVLVAGIAAYAMAGQDQALIQRSQGFLDGERAWGYAVALEGIAGGQLQRDASAQAELDGYSAKQAWWRPVTLPIDGGVITGQVVDLQGRFNLNNFAVAGQATVVDAEWQRLFESIPGLNTGDALPIAQAIRDWVDAGGVPAAGGYGGEDEAYFNNGYRTPNQPFVSPTELLAVRGMRPDIYRLLAPHIAALPTDGQKLSLVNVNTASLPVLLSLATGSDPALVTRWIAEREGNPTDKVDTLFSNNTLGAGAKPRVGVKSSFYLLQATVSVGTGRVGLYSVLMRPSGARAIVIHRSLDTQ